MAFWRRINQYKLQLLSNQYRRFYFQAPYASSLHKTRISVLEKPVCSIDKKPSYFYTNVRFFAAPVQAIKNKKEEPSKDGPRLNEKITARFVRLVTEEGDHSIVSIHAALEHARKLDLDLVEVQGMANPPVCKLMNFHQKRYEQRVKEKDRAKSKSGETLKKGQCKEVRFTEKIEAKDLKIKAESVMRLMERGYRVKCVAMGKGKEDVDENLGGLLSRLTDLIEDVSVVESGPLVERKQAYAIVRHVKFGPTKKGGGKTSKVVGGTMDEPPTELAIDRERAMLPQDDSMEMQDENAESKILHPEPVVNPTSPNISQYSRPETYLGTDNRYKRSEPRNWVPPARSMENMGQSTRESVRSEPQFPYTQRQPPQNMGQSTRESVRLEPQFPYPRRQPRQNMGQSTRELVRSEPQFPYPQRQPPQNMGQSTRESVRSEPPFPYPRQQPPQNMNASSSVRDTNQVENDASLFRNSKPPSNGLPKEQPSHTDVPGTPAPSFGIFSTPKANSSGKQGIAVDAHGSNEGNRYGKRGNGASQNLPGSKFDGSRRPDGNTGGQDRFGIFSKDR
ncbi:hypothetical protein CRYUN_Cryun10bG0147600 [Craigia yunnanensis]